MPEDKGNTSGENVAWIGIAVMIMVVAIIWATRKPIAIMATYSAYGMYWLLDKLHIAKGYQVDLMYKLGARMTLGYFDMSWPSIIALLNDAYRYPGVIIGALMALFGFGITLLNPARRYIRRMTMESLLFQQAQVFPEMRPVVGLGKTLLNRKTFDEGPWRLAEMPIQFAIKHGLLVDKNTKEKVVEKDSKKLDFRYARENYLLDTEAAKAAIEAQLGPSLVEGGEIRVSTLFTLPRAHRALLAAFILARWCSREDAFALLAQFSNSFWHPNPKKKPPISVDALDMRWVNDVLKAWLLGKPLPKECPYPAPKSKEVCQEIVAEIKKHAYANPMMFHMMEKARERGIIVVSDFIWLRPIDRTLFYTLNNAGRHNLKNATGFVEGIGPVAHWQVEQACGAALHDPDVREAVEGLESALYDEGWICHSRRNEALSSRRQVERARQRQAK